MAEHYYKREELINLLESVKGKTLGEVDKNKANVFKRTIDNPKITGIAGDVIEQSVLGYPPDTKQEPDLNVEGKPVELKTTGIKTSKNGNNKYEAKEPCSITAVSPNKIINEEFHNSMFWHKAERLLFVFYLYDSNKTVTAAEYANFPIVGYLFNEFNEEEKNTLCSDWTIVRDFIRDVVNRKLDINIEYPKISKLRDQCLMLDTAPKYPNNPRFRLKRSVVTNIYQKKYGGCLEELPKEYNSYYEIDKECHDLTERFIGMTIEEIANNLFIKDKLDNKAIGQIIAIKMFGGNSKKFNDVDIFNKYGIIGKTIVLTDKGAPSEQMKLFEIDFDEIKDTSIDFENSSFRDYFAQHQFLCIVFEEPSHDAPLKDNVFKGFKRISFSDDFIDKSVKPVWDKIRELVINNKLVDVIEYDKNGNSILNSAGNVISAPNFPKQKEGDVFVRGSGENSDHKSFYLNEIKMYHQYVWIKGVYMVKELNKQEYL